MTIRDLRGTSPSNQSSRRANSCQTQAGENRIHISKQTHAENPLEQEDHTKSVERGSHHVTTTGHQLGSFTETCLLQRRGVRAKHSAWLLPSLCGELEISNGGTDS